MALFVSFQDYYRYVRDHFGRRRGSNEREKYSSAEFSFSSSCSPRTTLSDLFATGMWAGVGLVIRLHFTLPVVIPLFWCRHFRTLFLALILCLSLPMKRCSPVMAEVWLYYYMWPSPTKLVLSRILGNMRCVITLKTAAHADDFDI